MKCYSYSLCYCLVKLVKFLSLCYRFLCFRWIKIIITKRKSNYIWLTTAWGMEHDVESRLQSHKNASLNFWNHQDPDLDSRLEIRTGFAVWEVCAFRVFLFINLFISYLFSHIYCIYSISVLLVMHIYLLLIKLIMLGSGLLLLIFMLSYHWSRQLRMPSQWHIAQQLCLYACCDPSWVSRYAGGLGVGRS